MIALIAILAAVLAPRVTAVIARGKVTGTVGSISSLSTATMDYIGAHSALPLRAGTGSTDKAETVGRFDADLQAGGHLEKLFATAIGSQPPTDGSAVKTPLTGRAHVRTLKAKLSETVATPSSKTGGDNFDLDQDATTVNFKMGQIVASAFIPGVAVTDAIALNKQIDGVVGSTTGDSAGRCLYSAIDSAGKVTVYVYLAHY